MIKNIESLYALSRTVRIDTLRMIQNAGSGNPGSAMSCVEILIWLLMYQMKINKNDPKDPLRDRLILSKGHSAPVYYSLCSHLGWIDRHELLGFRKFNTRLQTHPDYNTLNCVDYSSGSLGQGLSAANGMAIATNYLGFKGIKKFVLIGDGEMQEGQIWEAIMTAGFYELSNIVAIVDRNKFQQDGSIISTMDLMNLSEKVKAFNWEVKESDGHSIEELQQSFESMNSNSPKMIIADTIKGKGVSFMEDNNNWHIGGPKFTKEKLDEAINEIKNNA